MDEDEAKQEYRHDVPVAVIDHLAQHRGPKGPRRGLREILLGHLFHESILSRLRVGFHCPRFDPRSARAALTGLPVSRTMMGSSMMLVPGHGFFMQ